MANSIEIFNHLGPYEVKDVSDAILTMVATRGMPPVVIKQDAYTNGGHKVVAYAVLMSNDVRLACVHCFRRDMRITDSTRVKTCSSFVKHWSVRNGERVCSCKDDGQINDVVADCSTVEVKPVTSFTDDELFNELKSRGLTLGKRKSKSD